MLLMEVWATVDGNGAREGDEAVRTISADEAQERLDTAAAVSDRTEREAACRALARDLAVDLRNVDDGTGQTDPAVVESRIRDAVSDVRASACRARYGVVPETTSVWLCVAVEVVSWSTVILVAFLVGC